MGLGDVFRFINDPKYSDQKISEMKKAITDTGVYQDYIRPAADSIYEFVRTDNLFWWLLLWLLHPFLLPYGTLIAFRLSGVPSGGHTAWMLR